MSKSAEKVGGIIPQVLKNLGLDKKIEELRVIDCWEEIVGERIARVTKAKEVRDGVLFVEVSTGAWLQELSFRRKQIVALIRKKFKSAGIKDIHFSLDKEKGRE